MSAITTHVLDTARGGPVAGMHVRLSRIDRERAQTVGEGTTDADGRCGDLVPPGATLTAADYRLDFDTGAHYATIGVESFHPSVSVSFRVRDPDRHHHVPLLLAPWGYTTYRGS